VSSAPWRAPAAWVWQGCALARHSGRRSLHRRAFSKQRKQRRHRSAVDVKKRGAFISWVHMGPAKESTICFWNKGHHDTYINWQGAWYDYADNALFVPFCGKCMEHMHSNLTKKLRWTDEFEAMSDKGLPVAMALLAEQLVFKCQQLVAVPAIVVRVPEAYVEDGINMTDL
jgi:hypothetical protein